MGRPLFSSHTPAVRVEPEATYPTPEKWTYWKPFDPDADEFFENDDAVYEAFIDPAHLPLQDEGSGRRMTMVVEDSSSSGSSSSGRGSPMDESEGVSVEEIDLQLRQRTASAWYTTDVPEMDDGTRRQGASAAPPRARNVLYETLEDEDAARAYPPGEMVAPYTLHSSPATSPGTHAVRERVLPAPAPAESYARNLAIRGGSFTVVSPPLIPAVLPPLPPFPPLTPARPSTPPNQFSPFYGTPSPPPSVTPRLFSWSSRNPLASLPASPSAAGPLTNRSARLSVAHIAPALSVSRIRG